MLCSEMNACDGWVWCGTLFIVFINASLRTRAMPVAGSLQERERESKRKLGCEAAKCVSKKLRAEVQ